MANDLRFYKDIGHPFLAELQTVPFNLRSSNPCVSVYIHKTEKAGICFMMFPVSISLLS